jgi:hypothetical protein
MGAVPSKTRLQSNIHTTGSNIGMDDVQCRTVLLLLLKERMLCCRPVFQKVHTEY